MAEAMLTKKALAASLKALVGRQSLARVTVQEIVDGCGLNRQTFYYHFPDKFHLVNWIYDQEALGLIEDCRSYDTWGEGILRVLSTLARDRAFYVRALHEPGPHAFDAYLFRATQGLIRSVVDELEGNLSNSQQDKDFLADFYTYAFVGVVVRWIKDGMEEPPEALGRRMQLLVEGALRPALERLAVRSS